MSAIEHCQLEDIHVATSISPGVNWGPCLLFDRERPVIICSKIQESQVSEQIERYESALIATREQIEHFRNKFQYTEDDSGASIFEAHLAVLQDQVFNDKVYKLITESFYPADYAVQSTLQCLIATFAQIEDPYFQEKIIDLKDVVGRLLDNLTGWRGRNSVPQLLEPSIIVAKELTPSTTAQLDHSRILGIVTEVGGPTSHVAILARSLQIPAVSGLKNATSKVYNGEFLLLDGDNGILIRSPYPSTLGEYKERKQRKIRLNEQVQQNLDAPCLTKDGKELKVYANLDQADNFIKVQQTTFAGVGLMRTEFFFFNRTELPTEEDQYQVYRQIGQTLGGRTLVIRTLDMGADKKSPILAMPEEANPFLGCRAIRYCLRNMGIFKTQLRAILRASADAPGIKLLYPMISGLEEFEKVHEILEICKSELKEESLAFNPEIEEGIMIEVPSAVLLAEELAAKVKFFSIGTNDLIQYTLAVDRMNENVGNLYDPSHPAIVRLINSTVKAAQKRGIPVGLCGEMGSVLELVPLLIGLGIEEFSVSIPRVGWIRQLIQHLDSKKCRELAEKAVEQARSGEILKGTTEMARNAAPHLFE